MTFKKNLVFVFLVIAVIAIGIAEAQNGGISGLFRIQGRLYCTANGNINGTSTPFFTNALVQLQCGTGNTVASATTNRFGTFCMFLNPAQNLLTTLTSSCNLVVRTPLSNCDITLPSQGGLVSSLQSTGNFIFGLIALTNIIPTGFQFSDSVNLSTCT